MGRVWWLLALGWVGVVMGLSTEHFSAYRTGQLIVPLLARVLPNADGLFFEHLHLLIRKAAHVTVYATLATLWLCALRRSWRWTLRGAVWGALVVAVVVAFADEAHQAMLLARTGRIADMLLDSASAFTAVCVGQTLVRRRAPAVPAADAATTAKRAA